MLKSNNLAGFGARSATSGIRSWAWTEHKLSTTTLTTNKSFNGAIIGDPAPDRLIAVVMSGAFGAVTDIVWGDGAGGAGGTSFDVVTTINHHVFGLAYIPVGTVKNFYVYGTFMRNNFMDVYKIYGGTAAILSSVSLETVSGADTVNLNVFENSLSLWGCYVDFRSGTPATSSNTTKDSESYDSYNDADCPHFSRYHTSAETPFPGDFVTYSDDLSARFGAICIA